MLTRGGQEKQARQNDDPPCAIPDDVETVCDEGVSDNGHGDIDDVLRHMRRVGQVRVEVEGTVRLAAFFHESLDRSNHVYT